MVIKSVIRACLQNSEENSEQDTQDKSFASLQLDFNVSRESNFSQGLVSASYVAGACSSST